MAEAAGQILAVRVLPETLADRADLARAAGAVAMAQVELPATPPTAVLVAGDMGRGAAQLGTLLPAAAVRLRIPEIWVVKAEPPE